MAFADAFALADTVPGWLTEAQARELYDAANAVPPGGCVVEIGSHQGRSTVVLARAVAAGTSVVAVDPFPDDWRYGEAGTEQVFRSHLELAGVAERVDVRVATSNAVRRTWSTPVDLVYVDGKHDYWSLRDDLRWARHLTAGGRVFVHDAFSSLGVTTGLLRELLAPSSRLRLVGRTGSLAELARGRPTAADRRLVLAQLPWFARNLLVKVTLRLRLRPLTRLLGHAGPHDPY